MVMPSGSRSAGLSSGSAYCVAAPYVGLFLRWGAFCGFRGVRCWNLWRDALIYLGMETSNVLLVYSQLRVNPKNFVPSYSFVMTYKSSSALTRCSAYRLLVNLIKKSSTTSMNMMFLVLFFHRAGVCWTGSYMYFLNGFTSGHYQSYRIA